MPKLLRRALTERQCRSAQPVTGRNLKLADGDGLTLLVRPSGRKTWQLRVQNGGRERVDQLGDFPDVSLAAARKAAEVARVAARLAPVEDRRPTVLFESAVEDWLKVRTATLKSSYAEDIRERLAFNALPYLAKKPLRSISRADVIGVLERIVERGAHEQARRVRALLDQLFEWALIKELIDANPAPRALLRVLPQRPKVQGHAAPPIDSMPAVYRTISSYPSLSVSAALRFLVLTAARTSEVRLAKWAEVDLDAAIWAVPAERMKAGREHRVPLSAAAVALLRSMPRVSSTWIFPTGRGDRPLSNMALLTATKSMGFTWTVHGYRAAFSTWANESRAASEDVVEAALAHTIKGVRGAYDRGDRFDSRRALMAAWATAVGAEVR